MKKARGYSTDYPTAVGTGKRYLLDAIPVDLWSKVRTKARREGISIRALILKLVTEWVQA